MDDLQDIRNDVRSDLEEGREIRRNVQQNLMDCRRELENPNLSMEERREWEDIAFQSAQTLESLNDGIKETEALLSKIETSQAQARSDERIIYIVGYIVSGIIFLFIMFALLR